MKGKIKFMLAALLGFSAACSTVKNTPARGQEETKGVSDTVVRPHIIVMYGVRRPVDEPQSQRRMERMQQDSIAPVLEQPVDDMPVVPPAKN